MCAQRLNVKAVHLGVWVPKRRPPGEGDMPKRLEIWLFERVKVDEMAWNFHGGNPANRFQRDSLHRPSSAARNHAKISYSGWDERLPGSAKLKKRATGWHFDIKKRIDVDDLDLSTSTVTTSVDESRAKFTTEHGHPNSNALYWGRHTSSDERGGR